MLKKFYILSFIFLFLFSTIGIPLTLHLCSMQETASLDDCDMCSSQPVEINTCCSTIPDEAEVFFSKTIDVCCQVQLVDKKVKDEFFPKTELKELNLFPLVLINLSGSVLKIQELKNNNTELPPILQTSGKRYIDISLLLI